MGFTDVHKCVCVCVCVCVSQMRETRDLLESLLACEFVSLANFSNAHVMLNAAVACISDMGPGVMPSQTDLAALIVAQGGADAQARYDMGNTVSMDTYTHTHTHAHTGAHTPCVLPSTNGRRRSVNASVSPLAHARTHT